MFVGCDFFLHEWDERFHALVAKNLIHHFFIPTLYDNPILPYDYKNWTGNYIWLHKQPLPLWSMAFCMKLFGVNEIALRLPSMILSTAAIYLTHYIAKYFFDYKIALLSAFFHSIHGLIIEITGGRVPTDHIDIFFLFFIELAICLSIIFVKKEKILWNVFVGIAIGLAILCKWLPALIVLPIWLLILYREKRFSNKTIAINLFFIAISCIASFLPWQIYIFSNFPSEAKWEQLYNFKHFSETLGENGGAWYYYLDKIRIIYSELVYIPLLGFCYFLFKKKNFSFYIIAIWVFIPLIFFSFVETKMQGYILFTSPAIFIIYSWFFWFCYENKSKSKYKFLVNIFLVLLMLLPIRYTIERIKPFEKGNRNPDWVKSLQKVKINNTGQNGVLFGTSKYIEAMFYTDFTAYEKQPTEEEINFLKEKGYSIFVCTNDSIQSFEKIK